MAVSLLSGGIIGAGVFSLPYAFATAGLAVGFFYLVIAAVVYTFIHLMYADVVVKTEGKHRFVGYARRYLGKTAGLMAVLMGVVEMVFVLTIYLILSKSFLHLITPFGNTEQKILIFWILGSLAIFLNLRRIALSELLITISMVAIIALMFVLGIGHLDRLMTVPVLGDPQHWLLPLPAILFALSGRVVIPAVIDFLRGRNRGKDNRAQIRKVIIWATLLPAVVYGLFVLATIELSGAVSEDAVSGLLGQLSPFFLALIGVLGFLSLWSSYILVGLDVHETLRLDLKMGRLWRLALVVAAPLFLYIVGFTSFLTLVSFVGGIFLSFEGFFVILMYLKAHQVPSHPLMLFRGPHGYIAALLITAFLVALIAVIVGR